MRVGKFFIDVVEIFGVVSDCEIFCFFVFPFFFFFFE